MHKPLLKQFYSERKEFVPYWEILSLLDYSPTGMGKRTIHRELSPLQKYPSHLTASVSCLITMSVSCWITTPVPKKPLPNAEKQPPFSNTI